MAQDSVPWRVIPVDRRDSDGDTVVESTCCLFARTAAELTRRTASCQKSCQVDNSDPPVDATRLYPLPREARMY